MACPPSPPASLAQGLLLVLVLGLAAALGGCANPSQANPMDANPVQKEAPSPLPYGYREPEGTIGGRRQAVEGQALDEIVAVVNGEVLTRRRLIRETRGPRPVEGQEPDPAFERGLQQRRLQWARDQLLVKAALAEGMAVVPTMLDKYLQERKQELIEEASKNTGRPVTWDEVLAQERTSDEEFRKSVEQQVIKLLYLRKLFSGLGKGARPQVDMAVSPAEVRRLYREEPELFDEKQGVAFAQFLLSNVDALALGATTPLEAETMTARIAEEIAAAFRSGVPSEEIARRFKLAPGRWRENKELSFGFPYKPGTDWLFAPERRVRDAQVFAFEQVQGLVVLGVLEVRAAQKRGYVESYDDVVSVYQKARQARLESQRIIELVQGGSVVYPPSLADEIVDDAREFLRKLDEDERYRRARFR